MQVNADIDYSDTPRDPVGVAATLGKSGVGPFRQPRGGYSGSAVAAWTAPVLRLLGHGVRTQRFRMVPCSFGDELFIDPQQINPTPEAANCMIGMATKDFREKSVQGA